MMFSFFSWVELLLFQYFVDPSNLAEKKPSDQTGLYDGTGARDGDNRTCSSTGTYTQPWWWVDLQGLYVLHKVYIRNTENTDGCKFMHNVYMKKLGTL